MKNKDVEKRKKELIKELVNLVKDGDIVYFKASNGMRFTALYKDVEKKLENI